MVRPDHTLENIRVSLQRKLERQPLGAIQEKGVGAIKKMFIDDIESLELLLAHAIPEGISNVAVPVFVFLAMFFCRLETGAAEPVLPALGVCGHGGHVPAGHE